MKLLLDIYDALAKRLLEITEIKGVDWYNMQDLASDAKERAQLFKTPMVYISFGEVRMDTLLNGLQKGDVEFTVRLVTESMKGVRLAVGEHTAIAQKIYAKLQNFNCQYSYLSSINTDTTQLGGTPLINSIRRLSYKPDHNLTNLVVSEQRFTGLAFDNSAKKQYEKVPVSPKVVIT